MRFFLVFYYKFHTFATKYKKVHFPLPHQTLPDEDAWEQTMCIPKPSIVITFNSQIFRAMFGLLKATPSSMSRLTGLGRDTLRRAIISGDPKVSLLVDICNAYKLDISFFFDVEMRSLEELFVAEDKWSPIVFHPERIPDYQNMPEHIKCQTLAFWLNNQGVGLDGILTQELENGKTKDEPSEAAKVDENEDTDAPWVYFEHLFQSLPSILGVTKEHICKSSDHDIHMFIRSVVNKDLRVRTLLDVCNAYSIPIGLFFQRQGSTRIPSAVVQSGYSGQRFFPYRMKDLYGKGTDYTYSQFKDVLGYTNPRMIRMMSEDSPMTACELARFCNVIGISPSWFFQPTEDHAQMLRDRSTSATISNLEKKIALADAENAKLKSRIKQMEAKLG